MLSQLKATPAFYPISKIFKQLYRHEIESTSITSNPYAAASAGKRCNHVSTNASPLTAEEKADLQKNRDYGFLAKEDKHIKGAWDTYQQLKNSGIPVEHFEVVAIGGVVKNITVAQELGKFIQEKSDGVFKVTVCQIAMDRLKVEKKDLPKAADVTSNGYIRLYQLQTKQYLVIEP